MRTTAMFASPLALELAATPCRASTADTREDPGEQKEAIVVFGRGEDKIGIAHAASEGSLSSVSGVSGADLLVRVAELLEAVPGMAAAQHSGSGKANPYLLHGFNLDHGSNFTTYIDGVQMSFRPHGHGQGYLDLNGLIPEVAARADFRKNPYRADGGDMALAGGDLALAGAATMTMFDQPTWRGNACAPFYDGSMFSNPTYTEVDGSNARVRPFDKRWAPGLTGQKIRPNAARLRLIGGLYAGQYRCCVTARDAAAAAPGEGHGTAWLVSPRASVSWAASSRCELHANRGHGFHSHIACHYESPVPAVDSGGPVEGRLGRVAEPRTMRFGAQGTF